MVYRRTSKTGNYWKWVSVFLLVFGFFVPLLGGLVDAAPKQTRFTDLNITNSTLYNGSLEGGTVLLGDFNASGNIVRDAVLQNATLAGGAVFAGDVDARGYRFLNAVVYNGTLAGGTVFADVVDARGYRLKNAVLDNGTLTNGTVFADTVDARGYQLKNAIHYNGTLTGGTTFAGDVDARGYQLMNAVVNNGTLTGGTVFAGDIDARGYQLKNAVVNNATLLDAVVGTGSSASLNMNGNSLLGVQEIQARTGLNMILQAAPNQCIIAWNGSQGQIWNTCDGNSAGWPAGAAMQFRGHVVPESNNTYNLGASDKKWKNIYAVGNQIGDVNIDDVAVVRGSGDTLSFYSYNSQTKKLVEKVMELDLATGDLSVKGKIHEKVDFAPLTEEEKKTPFGE